MDLGNVVFGSLGLLGLVTTVETCVRGYDRFVDSARAPDRSNKFAIHVRIEQRRFQLYWEYMGLSATGCPLLQEQSIKTQQLIVDIAAEVKTLVSDAELLYKRYGFEGVSSNEDPDLELGSPSTPSTTPNSSVILDRLLRRSSSSDWFGSRPSLTRRQSMVWMWKDEKKAMELLKDLRDFNEQLWTSLAPHHEILLKQGEPAWILPGLNDVWAVRRLAGSEASGEHDALAVCSGLRTARLQPHSTEEVPFYDVKPATLQLNSSAGGLGPNRYLASLDGRSVIVEYKRGDPDMSSEEKAISRARLQALINVFAKENHPMLRILRGVTVFVDGPHRADFGLVFECPTPISSALVSYVTLGHLLAARANVSIPALGQRFKLAQALAKSIMLLHAAGWYHKSLQPENIVLQSIGSAGVDLAEPRIMGFDYSRPRRTGEPSLDDRYAAQLDLYVHPDRQSLNPPRFQPLHDYYSLAMCLTAIGWWRPIGSVEKKFRREFGPDATSAQWRAYMESEASTSLKSLCGELYAGATLMCLTGAFPTTAWSQREGQGWDYQDVFFTHVVKKLHMCRA